MFWVIQNNIYNEPAYDDLINTLQQYNLPYSVHKCIPFVGQLDPEPLPTQEKVIVMGSYTLALEATRRKWLPGAFFNENLNYITQIKHWQNSMFNSDAKLYTFKEVPKIYEPFFIRPIEDTKSFTGQVMDYPGFDEWRNNVLALGLNDPRDIRSDTLVMVCNKKPIYAEYRTWIVDQKVVAWSQYKTGTMKNYRSDVDERIIQFANEQANIWSPLRSYVMDIFDTPDGLKIGEVNCLNSAGWYAANVGKIIEALELAFN